jgi:hypothetical protein
VSHKAKTTCWEDKKSQNGVSSHGREIGTLFKKRAGVEYKITRNFKPNALFLMSLREAGGGSLIMTLPSKIMLLQLEDRETA